MLSLPTTSGLRCHLAVDVIEEAMLIRGWSIRRLAQEAHLDRDTIADMLAGRRRPQRPTVQACCIALGIPIASVVIIRRAASPSRFSSAQGALRPGGFRLVARTTLTTAGSYLTADQARCTLAPNQR